MPTREDIEALTRAYRELDSAKRSISWHTKHGQELSEKMRDHQESALQTGKNLAGWQAEVTRLERVCGVRS